MYPRTWVSRMLPLTIMLPLEYEYNCMRYAAALSAIICCGASFSGSRGSGACCKQLSRWLTRGCAWTTWCSASGTRRRASWRRSRGTKPLHRPRRGSNRCMSKTCRSARPMLGAPAGMASAARAGADTAAGTASQMAEVHAAV